MRSTIFAILALALLATSAFAGPVLVDSDEKPLNPGVVPVLTDGAELIPNQYIVVFKRDVPTPAARNFANSLSIGKFLNIDDKFRAFSGYIPESLLEKLRLRSDIIDYIEQDQVAYAEYLTQNGATWGLDRVDQRNLPLDTKFNYFNSAGSGVDVYIIDTGINLNHNDFTGRVSSGYNFHGGNNNADDDNGHGTHCAGTAAGTTYGLAKKAKLIAVKVLGANGSGSFSNVVAGVEWVANQHTSMKKSVANMSLGGGASTALDQAVAAAISKGVTMAVASGNSNADACNYSPARVATAITVNASNNKDNRASFSNWGSCTDIFAPGQDITSAWIGSSSSINTISGTSMATPHVAGAAAILLGESGRLSPAQVKAQILANATADKVSDPRGSPNKLLYVPYQ